MERTRRSPGRGGEPILASSSSDSNAVKNSSNRPVGHPTILVGSPAQTPLRGVDFSESSDVVLSTKGFYLDDTAIRRQPIQVNSIAKYSSFLPQTLACSPLVPGLFLDRTSASFNASSTTNKALDSLTALAGAQGITLFRTSRPHVPCLVLSHASASEEQILHSVQFQPSLSNNSLLLAAARGSAALVWDVSGQTLSPLLGRLEVDKIANKRQTAVTGLSWHRAEEHSRLLAVSTQSSVGVYDLRSPGILLLRPSVRLDAQLTGSFSDFVKVACSTGDHFAVLDSSGFLRVHDMRKPGSPLSNFSCFDEKGIGLEYLPSARKENTWVTWGSDLVGTGSVVRVWTAEEDQSELHIKRSETEDETVADTIPSFAGTTSGVDYGRLVAECSTPNLACARVCPFPIKDTIVTFGYPMSSEDKPGSSIWLADVWNIDDRGSNTIPDRLSSVVGRVDSSIWGQQGLSTEKQKHNVLHGVDLAYLSTVVERPPEDHTNDSDGPLNILGITVCSLVDNGLVMNHHLPKKVNEELLKDCVGKLAKVNDSAVKVRSIVFPYEKDIVMVDAASHWVEKTEDMISPTGEEIQVFAPSDAQPNASSSTLVTESATFGVPSKMGPPLVEKDHANNEKDRERVNKMLKEDSQRIPCPRLCGALFSHGKDSLSVFNNGSVGKLWTWYSEKEKQTEITDYEERQEQHDKELRTKKVYPRSLKDLLSMTHVAKEAEWGDKAYSEEIEEHLLPYNENLFEMDSDESSDEDLEDSQNIPASISDDPVTEEDTKRQLRENDEDVIKRISDGPTLAGQSSDEFAPSSDVLSPSVFVNSNYMNMKTRSMEYAVLWKTYLHAETNRHPNDTMVTESHNLVKESSQGSRTHLRLFRDEAGVRNGEYPSRPEKAETMAFLRKLYAHHQENTSEAKVLLSPPDSPMLPRGIVRKPFGQLAEDTYDKLAPSNVLVKEKHGAPLDSSVFSELRDVEGACLHNAQICFQHGDTEKSSVWTILSEAVALRRRELAGEFANSTTIKSSTYYRSFLDSTFSMYEARGDVQVLACIACVLRGYSNRQSFSDSPGHCFLSKDAPLRFDAYILKYSEILYCWGFLTERIEIMKYLSRSTSFFESFDEAGPPLDIERIFSLQMCNKEQETGVDISMNSQNEYSPSSLRCTICDNVIRGLFVLCDSCGHGGHLSHMEEWFGEHRVCASGCGCECAFRASHVGQADLVVLN